MAVRDNSELTPQAIRSISAPPIHVGVIGLGYHAMNVVRQLSKNPHRWKLAAMIDPAATSFARFQHEFHKLRTPCFKSLYDVDFLNEIHIMFIATTAPEHVRAASQLVELGYPNVILLEKPISNSLLEAERLQGTIAATSWQGTIRVDFDRRFAPIYSRVKQIIEKGSWGKLQHIEYKRRCKLSMKGSHYIDLACWFNGTEPVSVRATLAKESTIDTRGAFFFDPEGTLLVTFDDGTSFELDAIAANPDFLEGMTLRFEQGELHVDADETTLIQKHLDGTVETLFQETADTYYWIEKTIEAMVELHMPNQACSLEEATIGLELLTAAYHSNASGGKTISLPLTTDQRKLVLRVA